MTRDRTVALVGAGHAHLGVAARAEDLVACGARVVLIDPSQFWYSGLATGMLGGMYEPADDRVDPRALIDRHGGEFIQDRVERVDPAERTLHLARGTTLGYDLVSLNVGSRVNMEAIPGMADDPHVWPVKPVSQLWRLREYLETRGSGSDSMIIAVIGGGPTGAEVAANLTALSHRLGTSHRIRLITSAARLIPQAPAGAAHKLHRKLRNMGVEVYMGTRVLRRESDELLDAEGGRFTADLVVMATGLAAPPLVRRTGLPCHASDGLRVTPELHSVSDPRVFAAGDCAAVDGHDLPKLGVIGVRQAAIVYANLQGSLTNKPLTPYRPQKRYLTILNLGDGAALSTWGRFWWNGRSSLWLKDRIDRAFLDGYRPPG